MTIHAGVHLDDRSVIETHDCSHIAPGLGYLRLRPLADSIVIASVIHAKAPELRRLAAACAALADELDPPAYDDAYDAALLTSYGRINDLYENSPRLGETA